MLNTVCFCSSAFLTVIGESVIVRFTAATAVCSCVFCVFVVGSSFFGVEVFISSVFLTFQNGLGRHLDLENICNISVLFDGEVVALF